MARLTVEQKWWIDPRRTFLMSLLKDGADVDGLMIQVWRIAQEYWGQGQLIPWRVFSKFRGADKVIESDLAELRDGPHLESKSIQVTPSNWDGVFVYVRGAKDFFTWVLDIREKRKRGGQASAQRPRDAQGRLLKKPAKVQHASSTHPSEASTVQVSGSGSGFGFGSGLGSDSEKSKKTEIQKIEEASEGKGSPVQEFIRVYCEEFKFRYGTNPPIGGKGSGIAKRIVKDLGVARASRLAVAYLAMNDTWFIQRRHDLATLDGNLNAVAIFADTGASVTQGELRQADRAQTNQNVWDALKTNPGASHGK